MWRTSKDISLSIEATWPGILENLDSTARLARFAGPGGWNDAGKLLCSNDLIWPAAACCAPMLLACHVQQVGLSAAL